MKKTRRLLSLIMAAMMLTLSMVTGVWAEDVIITDIIDVIEPVVSEDEIIGEDIVVCEENIIDGEGSDDELMPLAANGCDYWDGQPTNAKKVTDSYLTQNGIDPHGLKYEVLGPGANISSYNIYKDSNGGLWLYSGSGAYVPTYTYI